MTIEHGALTTGLSAATVLLVMLIWSIAFPEKRLWPPKKSTLFNQFIVWGLTIAVFTSAFTLGVTGWNDANWPSAFRWGLGLPLILVGNLIVWQGVLQIGMKATSGDVDKLKTRGLYRYSRNPQYMADIAILVGWNLLCASASALTVVAMGIVVLLVAPLAEEPWLKKAYGKSYEDYSQEVRRYL